MKKMTKEQMIERMENQEQLILELQVKLENSKNGTQRKAQVLEILRDNSAISIVEIAKKLDITAKNVSSQLTYLRSDGYKVFTDNHGKKVLID